MKRSEMIDLIYEVIYRANKTQDFTMYDTAEAVLNAQERAGVLPPTSKIIKSIDAEMPALGKGKFNYEIEMNEWEPEDETK